ncbi:phosphate/phosphite/phosphonate ABC transporter substrate-binding protein [Candidatus Venteria ishoeyi]|uniref:phosphate/phosphite/phosphonate ABC transporter substrate-binding protein n=1 Tax=Candidatus Venteria ishoeyi TaxID=1899563 RepID=UPI0025A6033F|nr:phosphate/phosphite/phosphonate ABC transporter substrate-binding protein [Candidatus Venteria ishoeyi]MDM8546412.1 phosphate/phosphite/phosphonate ABC transporter substrate-binding protein [Candidatus Venteria ishoeyi]
MLQKKYWSCVCVFFLVCTFNVNAKDIYDLAVLSPKGVSIAKKEWQPTVDYLQQKTGKKFNLIPVTFKSYDNALASKKMEFLLCNPAVFYDARKKYDAIPLASLIGVYQNKPLHGFGAVIFTRADSGIQTFADLKGKKVAAAQKNALMGYRLPSHVLQEKGLEVEKDYALYFTGSLFNVAQAVKYGKADVGFVRTGFLQWFAKKEKTDISEFMVIKPEQDDFPFQHNGPILPFWIFGATKGTDPALNKEIATALMELKPSAFPVTAANVYGWEEPADLSPVGDIIDK